MTIDPERSSPSSNLPYSSVDWTVKRGNEDEFVERWKLLAEWMMDHPLNVRSMVLLRDTDDPQHFRSFLSWTKTEFQPEGRLFDRGRLLYDQCSALCESVESRYFLSAAQLYG